MLLRRLALRHYGIFSEATFDLRATPERPIVLVTGNNGAGKTSLLEAIRLALHGRRAFDVPLGEREYLRSIADRFHHGDMTKPCSVELDFEYVDLHRTRRVSIARSWALRRNTVGERLEVSVDGKFLDIEDADDLLTSIVPPEVARYFFFDGERIRELAEWETEDETALFAAVSDLLGLNVLDQLRLDLLKLTASEGKGKKRAGDAAASLLEAQEHSTILFEELKNARRSNRKLQMDVDKALADVRRVGALAQDEFAKLEAELAHLRAEEAALHEEATRAAIDMLPLLCAKTLRSRLGKELATRRRIEERDIFTAFLERHDEDLRSNLREAGFKPGDARCVLSVLEAAARGGGLVPVNAALPDLSRSDALWMERVITRDLPEMKKRNAAILTRLAILQNRISVLGARRLAVPKDDPTSEAALRMLETRQRTLVTHEAQITDLERRSADAERKLEAAQDMARGQRLNDFREGRLRVREMLTGKVLEALPTLAERMQTSKEVRLAKYLGDALRSLWNKSDRVVNVEISFAERRISLFDDYGELKKKDLSAGEKQLFAIAFIHALARLSERQMPFVIDTPLGRLDRQHRARFVADFLPTASHQVLLLSTDTEIVGELYDQLKPAVSSHIELADYNGGVTAPVAMALA